MENNNTNETEVLEKVVGELVKKRKRIFKSFKSKVIGGVIVLVILLLVIFGGFLKGYISAKEKSEQKIAELEAEIEKLSEPIATYEMASKEVNIAVINSSIQDIGELVTVEYLYTDAGKFSDPKQLFGHDIPFTTKSFIAKWDGTIKAGVDVNEITTEVNEEEKKIIIYIPQAKIMSHEIHNDTIETLDEKDGLFNPIEIDDVREFDAISKDAMEQKVKENGFLDKAYENAKVMIRKIVETDLVKELEYTVVFEEVQ